MVRVGHIPQVLSGQSRRKEVWLSIYCKTLHTVLRQLLDEPDVAVRDGSYIPQRDTGATAGCLVMGW